MADLIPISLDDEANLIDPPIIDHLYREGDSFIIGFIPDDATSPNSTEGVTIPCNSVEGRQTAAWLEELGRLFEFGHPAERVFHKGGGDFGFSGGGRSATMSQAGIAPQVALRAYDALQYLAQTAQAAFLISKRTLGARAPTPAPSPGPRVG